MPWNRREFISETGAMIPLNVEMSIDHALIHQGFAFTHSHYHTGIAAAATDDHLIITGDYEIHLRHLSYSSTGAPILLEYYENTVTSADGTPLLMGNNNRSSNKTPSFTLNSAPTVTGVGDPMGSTLIPSITNQGGGVAILAGGEWILAANTKYLIRLTNQDNSEIDYTIDMFVLDPFTKNHS